MRKKYVALAVIVFLIGISALGGCNFRSDSVAVVNEKNTGTYSILSVNYVILQKKERIKVLYLSLTLSFL